MGKILKRNCARTKKEALHTVSLFFFSLTNVIQRTLRNSENTLSSFLFFKSFFFYFVLSLCVEGGLFFPRLLDREKGLFVSLNAILCYGHPLTQKEKATPHVLERNHTSDLVSGIYSIRIQCDL